MAAQRARRVRSAHALAPATQMLRLTACPVLIQVCAINLVPLVSSRVTCRWAVTSTLPVWAQCTLDHSWTRQLLISGVASAVSIREAGARIHPATGFHWSKAMLPLLLRAVCAAMLVLLVRDIADACCLPNRNHNPSGTLYYHFAPGVLAWTETDKNDFRQAANAWNSKLQEQGSDVRFQESSSSGVAVVWELQSPWGSYGGNHIRLRTDLLSESASFKRSTMGHELGHYLGFGHAGCSQSIMVEGGPSDPYPEWPTNCDGSAIANYWASACAGGGCTPGYTRNTTLCSGFVWDYCGCCLNETPLLLQFDNDEVTLSGLEDGVTFDINGAGRLYRMGWPGKSSQAWLVWDRNRNGIVDDGSEMFGNTMRLPDGTLRSDGFAALSYFDENRDRRIDRSDSVFSSIRLWFDRNRDATTDDGELLSLADARVTALGLDPARSDDRDRAGNRILLRSWAAMSDGRRVRLLDIFPVVTPVGPATCGNQPTATRRGVTQ